MNDELRNDTSIVMSKTSEDDECISITTVKCICYVNCFAISFMCCYHAAVYKLATDSSSIITFTDVGDVSSNVAFKSFTTILL